MNLRNTAIGLELGSTRIKAVLVDQRHEVLASGSFVWNNRLEDGVWTYHYDEVVEGLQACFADLKANVLSSCGVELTTTGAMGISGMMHGYIASDSGFRPLCPFRTWRNTMTGEAAAKLTEVFGFNIPQRWSIAHLYQSVLDGAEHVGELAHVETLAAYVHRLLTGENVLGVDDASGMFPIDPKTMDYDAAMADKFLSLTGFDVRKVFPKILVAGSNAGVLSVEGARLLDPSGSFGPGIPMAPPEGDAGTGMVATDSIRNGSGNISAGTSDFLMVVTDRKMEVHREVDMVMTPAGLPVAMIHCNNCTTDINAWVGLFGQFAEMMGFKVERNDLFNSLYSAALKGRPDCDGMVSCNYYSGEGVTDLDEGIPLFLHSPSSGMDLPSFMRCHLMSAMATLRKGVELLKAEGVPFERIMGHGGFFKTPQAGQRILSAALNCPVSVMETAGEGGPYGMALLTAYMLWGDGLALEEYLDRRVFASCPTSTVIADGEEVRGFSEYARNYDAMLDVERRALEKMEF